MRGYSPACLVQGNRACHEFHAALHKGGEAVRRFLAGGCEEGGGVAKAGEGGARVGGATGGGFSMWWKPLLGEEEEAKRWRRLFETSEHFRRWVLRHGGGGGELAQTAFVASIQEHYAKGTLPPYTPAQFVCA